ncbi:hypothetical protein [Actinomycetospora soli]|uniref:hypothetical protein n=1 Tax=Actinomycetospora soli TaxID=2893887 RepID=UPI001E5CD985|nr:hypothetical protein [Actinomycetospora soli]MCD2191243.1 hypothetical protein [Actinomycetospora soli]
MSQQTSSDRPDYAAAFGEDARDGVHQLGHHHSPRLIRPGRRETVLGPWREHGVPVLEVDLTTVSTETELLAQVIAVLDLDIEPAALRAALWRALNTQLRRLPYWLNDCRGVEYEFARLRPTRVREALVILDGLDELASRDLQLAGWSTIAAPRLFRELGMVTWVKFSLRESTGAASTGTSGRDEAPVSSAAVPEATGLLHSQVLASSTPWVLRPGLTAADLSTSWLLDGSPYTHIKVGDLARTRPGSAHGDLYRLFTRILDAFPHPEVWPTTGGYFEGGPGHDRFNDVLADVVELWPRRALIEVRGWSELAATDLHAAVWALEVLHGTAQVAPLAGCDLTIVYTLPAETGTETRTESLESEEHQP